MKMQEAFDIVVTHALKQNERALINPEGEDSDDCSCRYRTPNGLKCFVGALIPDDHYHPEMEGNNVADLLRSFSPDYLLLENESPLIQEDFYSHLQEIHDYHEPAEWRKELINLAIEHHLAIPDELTK